MLFVMFSMAGIPFFVGFFAKFSVLQSVLRAELYGLAVLAVLMSLIGAFYYLRVVKFMYFDEPIDSTPIKASSELQVMLSINGAAIALLGLMPGTLLGWCEGAMKAAAFVN
jgi:NADH-quinone oxidoreductase subunit N